MPAITATALHQLLADHPGATVIDVRTPAEFAEVHATPAVNVPLGGLDPGAFPHASPVYILCQSGQRASNAAEILTRSGHPDAVFVQGGTKAWIDAGLPVVRGGRGAISLERQVRIAAGSLVLTGFLLGWFVNPLCFILSGFVGAGFIFAGITDWCGMGLLIAKAPWNK